MIMKNATMTTSKGNNTTVDDAATAIQRSWNNPVPFLFGGLALMLCLIAMALLILACSFRKYSSSNGNNNVDGTRKTTSNLPAPASQNESKFVVIMAGNDNPTYFAKPLPSPMIIPYSTNHHIVIGRV
uniref:Uncharacterized protein n=1 Tax=Chenopodium quinoa TaxID=63459 RepID=A0A803LC52_CHEQI